MQALQADLVEQLHQRLWAGANAGGWAYYAGKSSRIEPTCWALLALNGLAANRSNDLAAMLRPHVAYLTGLQGNDGLLVETEPSLVNVTANALALLTLRAVGGADVAGNAARLRSALIAIKGVSLTEPDPKQDNSLQGWPWVRDTFSWVEPTAWALLALKRERHATESGAGAATGSTAGGARENDAGAARRDEAERLLLNRVCAEGGWNYGNASTLGQDLRAYVPTTAAALLALQDRRSLPAVEQSLTMLVEHQTAERGTMSLALVSICLNLFGVPTGRVDEQLADAAARSVASGNLLAVAMAAFALSAGQHHAEVLRVA